MNKKNNGRPCLSRSMRIIPQYNEMPDTQEVKALILELYPVQVYGGEYTAILLSALD